MLQLAFLVSKIGQFERDTEQVRQVLAEIKKFEPYTAYRRLDKSRCGLVYQQDLKDFMARNGLFISDLEASYLFQFLDFNHDGKISYTDFVKQILPKDNVRLREQVTMRQSHFIEINSTLSLEIEWGLFTLFEKEIQQFQQLEQVKHQSKKINVQQAFNYIDNQGLGYINYQSLEQFLITYEQPIVRDDIIAFFRKSNDVFFFSILYSNEFRILVCNFHPSQIIRNKERAYYSTPKKYRRQCDLSPNLRGSLQKYDINKSAIILSKHNASSSFIYRTPIKNQAAPGMELDKQKRKLMKQPDFNLAQLYHKSAIKNVSFQQFCNYILPIHPPKPQTNNKISAQTLSLMFKILQKQVVQ